MPLFASKVLFARSVHLRSLHSLYFQFAMFGPKPALLQLVRKLNKGLIFIQEHYELYGCQFTTAVRSTFNQIQQTSNASLCDGEKTRIQ